jgi:hypothetical protein
MGPDEDLLSGRSDDDRDVGWGAGDGSEPGSDAGPDAAAEEERMLRERPPHHGS